MLVEHRHPFSYGVLALRRSFLSSPLRRPCSGESTPLAVFVQPRARTRAPNRTRHHRRRSCIRQRRYLQNLARLHIRTIHIPDPVRSQLPTECPFIIVRVNYTYSHCASARYPDSIFSTSSSLKSPIWRRSWYLHSLSSLTHRPMRTPLSIWIFQHHPPLQALPVSTQHEDHRGRVP